MYGKIPIIPVTTTTPTYHFAGIARACALILKKMPLKFITYTAIKASQQKKLGGVHGLQILLFVLACCLLFLCQFGLGLSLQNLATIFV